MDEGVAQQIYVLSEGHVCRAAVTAHNCMQLLKHSLGQIALRLLYQTKSLYYLLMLFFLKSQLSSQGWDGQLLLINVLQSDLIAKYNLELLMVCFKIKNIKAHVV